MVERRTERRVHLFRPDPLMDQVFLYCLGYALEKTGMRLMATERQHRSLHRDLPRPADQDDAGSARLAGQRS
jgi:hypothetical protein